MSVYLRCPPLSAASKTIENSPASYTRCASFARTADGVLVKKASKASSLPVYLYVNKLCYTAKKAGEVAVNLCASTSSVITLL